MLCCQLFRTGPWSKYTDRGSICADRRSQPSPTLRRSRNVQGPRNDTATIIFIRRSVAVPADSSTRRILRHHELLKRLGRYTTDLACNVGERQKVIGNARIGAWLLACEDIPVPKGVYAAIAQMSVKFKGLQRPLFESLNEALLVGGRYYIRDIAETAAQAPQTGRPCC